MRSTFGPALFLAGTIVLSLASAALAVAPNENGIKIPADLLPKFDDDMLRELRIGDSPIVDAIVVYRPGGHLGEMQMAREAIGNFRVTQEWPGFPFFRAELTKEQVCDIARLPFVTRIDNNSCSGQLCMDTARSYTNVDYVRSLHPYLDGNLDPPLDIYYGSDIVIAIIDTGVDASHHDLNGGKVVGWLDLVNGNPNPYDDNGHGTHCASIAAGAGDANWNYRGVAPYAALVCVKAFDSQGHSTEARLLEAMDWVLDNRVSQGIEIVSCSWCCGDDGDYNAIALAADILVDAGLVVVAAQGNTDRGWTRVPPPGTGKYVITVGAAADPGEGGWSKASFSLPGPCDDGRIKPDVLAPGVQINAAKKGTVNQYVEMDGTSMATPFVAGLVALWLDYDMSLKDHHHPDINPEIKHVLMGSAIDVPGDTTPGKDNYYGAGRVDMLANWNFVNNDVSTGFSNAPLALGYSWYEQSYLKSDQGLWPYDDALPYGDYYKLNAYSSILIYVVASGDPDLLLKIRLYNQYQTLLSQSTTGNYRTLGWTAGYTGVYYVRITAESLTADWYDVQIFTAPS